MTTTLSEAESKALLSSYGVMFLPEALVANPTEAIAFAEEFDVPMALKLCGSNIAHKSERGLVRLGIVGPDAISRACQELLDAARPEDNATGVLVAPMASGLREFIVGIAVDPVFGPTVVFGLGGVHAEAIADVHSDVMTRSTCCTRCGANRCSALSAVSPRSIVPHSRICSAPCQLPLQK